MATITSAGAGSGIDLESVISASVAAKKTQLQQPITTKKTNTQITLRIERGYVGANVHSHNGFS